MNRFKFHLMVAIIFYSQMALSQFMIFNKNGETIPFEKYRFKKKGIVTLKTSDGKMELPFSEVEGFYGPEGPLVYYLKPYYDEDPEQYMTFMERYIEGEINVYRWVLVKSYSSNGVRHYSRTIHYFAEKGEIWEEIPRKSLRTTKKKIIDEILPLISDCQPAVDKMTRLDDFEINELLDLIRTYNLEKYKLETGDENALAKVVFSRPIKKELAGRLSIQVGEKVYEMGPGDTREFNIPEGTLTRACVTNAQEESKCDLVKTRKGTTIKFLISHSEKEGLIIGAADAENKIGLFK